ncbi:MAG: RHS repeat-associated core domain-containing protein [Bacteroidota bacterium]
MEDIGGKTKYHYNGKELNKDFGLNWLDYGARWYDASIARWNAVDPLAEKYTSWSPYNYVIGDPISLIDPDGTSVETFTGTAAQELFRQLQENQKAEEPIYDENGKLIGYRVEHGQGPTQIAEDLNTYYSCELTCEASWIEIVYNNREKFKNVFNGEGEINDEYNGDYKSGNIEPGDILIIANGSESTKGLIISQINKNNKSLDSIKRVNQQDDAKNATELATDHRYKPHPGDPAGGIELLKGKQTVQLFRRMIKRAKLRKQLERKNDSLRTELKKIND